MDVLLFEKINSLAGINNSLDKTISFFGEYLAYIMAGLFIIALIWPRILGIQKRLPIVLALISALFARYFVKIPIIFFYNRPRPFNILEITPLISHESFGSFPSGHALFFFTLATFLILFNRKAGYFLFVIAILISMGRVMAGVHWPSDILAGASFGILIGVSAFTLYRKISKTKITSSTSS